MKCGNVTFCRHCGMFSIITRLVLFTSCENSYIFTGLHVVLCEKLKSQRYRIDLSEKALRLYFAMSESVRGPYLRMS